MITRLTLLWWPEHFAMYVNIQSVCCAPETNIICYVTYTSIKKSFLSLSLLGRVRKLTGEQIKFQTKVSAKKQIQHSHGVENDYEWIIGWLMIISQNDGKAPLKVFELRPAHWEGARCVEIWVEVVPGRGNSKCQVPDTWVSLARFRNQKKATVSDLQWGKGTCQGVSGEVGSFAKLCGLW